MRMREGGVVLSKDGGARLMLTLRTQSVWIVCFAFFMMRFEPRSLLQSRVGAPEPDSGEGHDDDKDLWVEG